ncbi:MAG: MCE family protein [Mycobacteriaceae bacterium]
MIIDPSDRGPTMNSLMLRGFLTLVVAALLGFLLSAKYRGEFATEVTVTAQMVDVGDGLPNNADVKYRGVLVGSVVGSGISEENSGKYLELKLNSNFSENIPENTTARIVPSNIFAVSSIELLSPNNPSPKSIADGVKIFQDKSASTLALQSAMDSLRRILTAIDSSKLGQALGTISDTLRGRGAEIGKMIDDLASYLPAINSSFPDPNKDLNSLESALVGINQSAPELIETIGKTVGPSKLLFEKQSELKSLMTAGGALLGSVNNLIQSNGDNGIRVVQGLAPTLSAVMDQPKAISELISTLRNFANKVGNSLNGINGQLLFNMIVSLTPAKPYTQDDCPKYGGMVGPNCSDILPGATGVSDNGVDGYKVFHGNIGGVGSKQERQAASVVLGREVTDADILMFGPILRGTTSYFVQSGGERK